MGLISASHCTHLTTSTPRRSNTTLATANEKDKIMQTFPNPTCLASSFFSPESLQTFQLSLSSFFHDLMTSLILQKCLLLVLDILEIQLYFCKALQFFCLIYFISSPTFSILPSSSQDFILNSFLIFIHFQFCPLNHSTCRIFFSLFSVLHRFFMTT